MSTATRAEYDAYYTRQQADDLARDQRRRNARAGAATLAGRLAKWLEARNPGETITVKRGDANTYVTRGDGKTRYRLQPRAVRFQRHEAPYGWLDGRSYTHTQLEAILAKDGF